MRLLALTNARNGLAMYINPEHVSAVCESEEENVAELYLGEDGTCFEVRGRASAIAVDVIAGAE